MEKMMQNVTKVLVVDDSAFMRKVISDILKGSPQIKVVGTAKNGKEALEQVKALQPDVVTLDIEMPVMDGLSCLKELLKEGHIPIVMLSSLTRAGADDTIQALELGAVDFITKPTNIFDMTGEDKKQEIVEKVKMAKEAVGFRRDGARRIRETRREPVIKSSNIRNIVAIGTSTGGPKALQDVIPEIPGDVPAAFLIVQHMPAGFTKSLADRLNSMSELTVKEAEDGELVKPGHAYIAPGDYHMTVEKYAAESLKIKLAQTPTVGGHRPSVNVMMDSVASTGLTNLIGVIMTGMGGDGSEGLKKIKNENRGFIIAQDEKSCVVYGMPKVAIQSGVVDVIVPLKDIAKEIMKIVGVQKSWI